MVGARALAILGSVHASIRESGGRTLFACIVHGSELQNCTRGNTLGRCVEWLRSPAASTRMGNIEAPLAYLCGGGVYEYTQDSTNSMSGH